MNEKSFTFHEHWKNVLTGLPAKVRLEVYDAIIEYGLSGTLTELETTAGLAFTIFKNDIDNDNRRIKSIRAKRSEAGKRHKGNQYSKKKMEQMEQVFHSTWNKCSTTPVNKGVSEDFKNGTNVPNTFLKESPPLPPDKETSPITPKEINPPISPQENLSPVTRAKRFVKPSVQDIRSYCEEKGYAVDPEQFWNFYESKGWVVGKSPMKSWKAAIITWIKRNHATTRTDRNTTQTSPSDDQLVRDTAELVGSLQAQRRNREAKVR